MNNSNMNEPKDEVLWQIAKEWVGFKWSLLSYIFVNLFLISISIPKSISRKSR